VSRHHSTSDEVLELRRLTTTLQVQLQQSQAEVRHLRSQLEAEYDAGFYRGQAQGFREAQELSSRGELAAPPNKPTRHSRRQVTPDLDEREAEELHQAMQQSRRAVRPGPPETSTPGAGPSRARGPKGSGEPRPSRGAANPVTPHTIPPTRTYTIPVVKKSGEYHTDPKQVKWEGLAHIPLPIEASPGKGNTVEVCGPAKPPKAEEANSYLELWAAFANGVSVPEVFTRLHTAYGYATPTTEAREAVLGYGLTRRIIVANAKGMKKDSVNAFLVLLATLAREMDLIGTEGIWSDILKRVAPAPVDNWGALTAAFTSNPLWARTDFGIHFHPPQQPSQPWDITTGWHRDAFMQVLLAVRPSVSSIWSLAVYGDFFIRSRWAHQPLPGVTLQGQIEGCTYPAPFMGTPPTAPAFLANHKEEMEVDPSGVHPTPPDVPGNTGA
jgi:hypothetical protein